MGIELKITAKGQITLKKELMEHLMVKPGDSVSVDIAARGHVSIHRIQKTHSINDIVGILKRPPGVKHATLKDIEDAIAKGWAGDTSLQDGPV
jgi:bifunctional DNA-binding transcriptional regulator/antitoxin component of YhaV-PrlF toxin-antitoxin module